MEHGGGARFARLGDGARFARLGDGARFARLGGGARFAHLILENLPRTSENLQRTFRESFLYIFSRANLQRTHAGTREPGSGNFPGRTRASEDE